MPSPCSSCLGDRRLVSTPFLFLHLEQNLARRCHFKEFAEFDGIPYEVSCRMAQLYKSRMSANSITVAFVRIPP